MKYIQNILVIILFSCISIPAIAQCSPNLGFESGLGSGAYGMDNWYYYNSLCFSTPWPASVFNWNFPALPTGIDPSREILTSGPGVDAFGGFPTVWTGTGGASTKSLQLGTSATGRRAERAAYRFVVPPSTSGSFSIEYHFAVVLQEPISNDPQTGAECPGKHEPGEMPRFAVTAFDETDNVPLPCAQFLYVVGPGSMPGFTLSPASVISDCFDSNPIWYLPWTTGNINLVAQAGHTIRLEVSAAGCTLGGHFGYGYFDADCFLLAKEYTRCAGTPPTSLAAPSGYMSYQWYEWPSLTPVTPMGSQNVGVSPTSNTEYAVVMNPYPGFGCPETLFTKVVVVDAPDPFNIFVPDHFCEGDQVTCTTDGPGGGTWSCTSTPAGIANIDPVTGDLTIASPCTITSPGSVNITYTVINYCGTFPSTVTVPVYPSPDFTMWGPSCVCTGSTFTLGSAITCGGSGGVSYYWDRGGSITHDYEHGPVVPRKPCQISQLSVPLTVTNSYGCSTTHFHDVTVYPKPEIYAIDGPAVVCAGDKVGLRAKKCGDGFWVIISGASGVSSLLPTADDAEFNFVAANVCCPTTVTVRYIVSSPCTSPSCASATQDYTFVVKPKPYAGITILSCNPLCPGNDVELQVCGMAGATVHFSYAYPGCPPVDQTLVLPAGPCCLSVCTTLVVPRLPCGTMAEGYFVAGLGLVEFDGCSKFYGTEERIRIAYPSATITLLGPPPCQGDPYCIRITGTPGARVNLGPEYMAYDPSFPTYVDLPPSPTGSDTYVDICGLVIPPPAPGGTAYGMNSFCIQSIVAPAACGGCMVESAEGYIDVLHHPLPCLNVISRELPQFGLSYAGPVCKPNPFTMTVNVYALGGAPAAILWGHVPGFFTSWGVDGSPTVGPNYETVNPGLPGSYSVMVVGTNGCHTVKTLNVLPSPPVPVPTMSIIGSVCEGTIAPIGVTFTGLPGTTIFYKISPPGVIYHLTLDWTGTITVPMTVAPLTTITITDLAHPGYCKAKGPFGKISVPMNPAPKADINCSGNLCGGWGVGSSVSLTFMGTFGATVTYTSSPLATGMPATATIPTSVSITPAPTVPTTYSITDVVNPVTGCHSITSPAPCTTEVVEAPPCPPPYSYSATTHNIMFTSPVGGTINCTFVDALGTILNPTPIPVAVGTIYTIPATTAYIFINPIEIKGCSFGYDCVLFPVESAGGGGTSTEGEAGRGTNNGQGTANIEEMIKVANSLSVMPNPNAGSFTLTGYIQQLANAKEVTIEISDMLGRTVFAEQSPVSNGKINKQITMTNVANGTYLVRVKGEGVNQAVRFTLNQ